MNRRNHFCSRRTLAALACGLVLLAASWPGRTQPSQPVVGGRGFKFTEYYPPQETQLKSLLECGQAQLQPDGRYLITGAKYQTFHENGKGELTVEAPQCVFDSGQRSISSPGSLRVQTADGKFAIEGEGFLWQQTNSTLLVSNRVHTTLHPELLSRHSTNATAEAQAAQGPGIEIYSDQFEYGQNSGLGIYQGNVRVAGTNLISTAGKLTILLPVAERRLQSLTAEQNVVVDYEKIHATAERAFYSADTDVIQLTGQPTWRIEQRDGSGDELVFERTNRVFRANGHARIKLPAQSMGASGFLSQPSSAAASTLPATNHFVEILADSYEIHTNLAVFRQDVRVSDRLGERLEGEMSCGLLTLTLAGTNELQKMVAEHRVVIGQADKQFTAEKAEYTGTNGLLELTDNPTWRAGAREGQGDWMRVNLKREEMLVHGNALMKFPAAELGQSDFAALGSRKRSESTGGTNAFAMITSREYFLTPESALFRGSVRIEHPQTKWACEEITMLSPPELGKTGRMIIAEPEVVFDLADEQGRNFHGTGKKVVYTHRITATLTNDIVELTGNPATLEATNLFGRNNVIILDLASQKFLVPGKYKLWGAAPDIAIPTLRSPKARK